MGRCEVESATSMERKAKMSNSAPHDVSFGGPSKGQSLEAWYVEICSMSQLHTHVITVISDCDGDLVHAQHQSGIAKERFDNLHGSILEGLGGVADAASKDSYWWHRMTDLNDLTGVVC